MMVALGRALMFSSHQRAAVRVPMVRFYQELQVFTDRAIFDCAQTVEAVERARLEYRGSLLWMKKTSEELDPDTDQQLEKFREAQSAVRLNKEKLDKLKIDTLQKVDLLSASRSNLLSHLLGKYLDMLCAFYERTCRAYTALSANLSTFQHYEFEILTDLIEPSKKVARNVRQASLDKEAQDAGYSRVANEAESEEPVEKLLNFDDEPEGSLKKYLFGRDSPVESNIEETEEERQDSPLGIADFEPDYIGDEPQSQQSSKVLIGPLPTLLDTEAEVPLLAPPPRAVQTQPSSSRAETVSNFNFNTDDSGYSAQDLFPLVGQTKPEVSSQDNVIDLLGAPSSQFPNPFDESKTTEWDLLLSQCDIQQSGDLI
ncbi:ATP-dependent DNA helicase [Trichostrongylus colubriformis]|uniref:ATP-dependent DNA helicase n=1 Tax=Trichostrongylus colubriformis TaxID=6319 RepID=A0AAN8EZL7_TRICO